MKSMALLVPVLAAAWAVAPKPLAQQDNAELHGSPMTPVAPAMEHDIQSAREQLRSDELADRRQAYAQLLRWSLRSPEVAATIKEWAAGDDIELAWTSELLLRELQRQMPTGPAGPRFLGGHFPSPFDRQQQLLLDLQDLFQSPVDGWMHYPFQGFGGWPGQGSGAPQGGHQSAENMRVQMGPEGVKVEWNETVDGEETLRSYEADSMEQLIEEHPELGDKLSFSQGFGGFGQAMQPPANFFGRDPWSGIRQQLDAFGGSPRSGLTPGLGRPSRTDILGVQVTPPEQRSTPIPDVADDLGMTIQRVVPRTIASALGLRPGQTILSVNDISVYKVEDIRDALEQRAPKDTLRVEIATPDGHTQTLEWDPAAREVEVH